ncbi:MAG: hypothetical protein ACLUP7_02235 [Eubacterium sp.]
MLKNVLIQLRYEELKRIFCLDSLEIAISNTTEAGICFIDTDKMSESPNVSFPKVTALLMSVSSRAKGLVFYLLNLLKITVMNSKMHY